MEKPRWVDSHFVSQITEITALVHKLLSLALKWCNYKTNCDKTERGIGNRAVTQSSVARFCLLLRCWMPVKSAKVLLNKMLVQPPYCRHVWLTCWLTALSAGWTLGFHNWNMTVMHSFCFSVWKSYVFTSQIMNKGFEMSCQGEHLTNVGCYRS